MGIKFGLNLILPIGNVFQSLLLGLNVGQARCSNGQILPTGSIKAFGGPILYLVLQVLFLMGVIIWIEGDLAIFRRKSSRAAPKRDAEKSVGSSLTDDAEQERLRVENSDSDLLRMINFSKSFGSNQAVENVTLGLPQSDVTALIGPNGAGKSTLVNLIQSEISPDAGQAYLCGEDWRTRSAQGHLGGKQLPPRNPQRYYLLTLLSSVPAIRCSRFDEHKRSPDILCSYKRREECQGER